MTYILPALGFVSTISVALSQVKYFGDSQIAPFFLSTTAILASAAVTAISTWIATKRFNEKYLSFFSSYIALSKLADSIEYDLLRAVETGNTAEISPDRVNEWRSALKAILLDSASSYEKHHKPEAGQKKPMEKHNHVDA
jgi:hypothetical protein